MKTIPIQRDDGTWCECPQAHVCAAFGDCGHAVPATWVDAVLVMIVLAVIGAAVFWGI